MDFLFTMVNLIAKGIIYPTSFVKIFGALLFLLAFRAIRDYRRRRRGLPYPPSPRPLPIIGNLLDIPRKFSWLAYTNFSKTHGSQPFFATVLLSSLTRVPGDILSFHIFGQVIVVLNSAKVAKDLFEKRGAIYSDRSPAPIYDMWVLEYSM